MSKLDALRALREAKIGRKSSSGPTMEQASTARTRRSEDRDRVEVRPDRKPEAGKKSEPLQMPASSVSSGPAMGITAGQALGPLETKRGRPRLGETRDRPWETLGMSKRTYYRRQAEKRIK